MLTIGGYIGQKYFVEVLFCWAVGAPLTIKQGVECRVDRCAKSL